MRGLYISFALLWLPVFGQENYLISLQRTDPQYSEEALIAGLEGSVQVSASVAADGALKDLHVIRPLGLGLDEKALDAVSTWRFPPAGLHPSTITVPVDFRLRSKFSRWHLVGAQFQLSEGVTRPVFSRASYPTGAGISPNAYDEGRLLGAIGRPANVTLAFDIDDHGRPGRFEVVKASYDVWGYEAANLVEGWQFAPAMKDGMPVPVRCTVDLVWGAETLSTATIAQQLDVLHPAARAPRSEANRSPAPVPIQMDAPSYTEEARAAGLEGVMRVGFLIGEDGKPLDVKVLEHLGLGLDDQAIQAVSRWRFQPASVEGRPSLVPEVVQMNFELTGVSWEFAGAALPAPRPAVRK
ncbi:MAG TPA: TonB family protein [Bryobacteraceae bacterium]|jgi:TonB family protein